MTGWAFYALGTPAPQGSKSPKGRTKDGRTIMVESSKKLAPWRDTVTAAAFGAGEKLDGPIAVRMVFTVNKPKTTKDTGPCRTPDLSKLARSTEDAITAAGLWADDARVVEYTRLAKVWPGGNDSLPVPGVVVAACTLAPGYGRWQLGELFGPIHGGAWTLYRNHQLGGAA